MEQPERDGLITVEEYLEGERQAEIRHEFIGGQTYAMVGGTDRHNRIAGNLYVALHSEARRNGCGLFMADMKVRLSVAGEDAFYYPDLMVACDPADDQPYYRTAPCLLLEVLSGSTHRIDRREKLFAYTTIPSLQEYLVVTQNEPRVEIHRREVDGWVTSTVRDQGTVDIRCLKAAVDLETIYADLPPIREE
jgi:Uma2 family endonuclease